MQLVYEVILPNKVLRNHLLSENMQWNYASLNVTLNYLMHEIMEFCVTSSLALDNWGQERCQILGNKPNHSHQVSCDSLFHSVYLVFPKSLFSIENLFAVRYLWDVCIEDKCCVVTQRGSHSRRLDCLLGLFTFARIACILQLWIKQANLGDAQIKNFSLSRCTWIKSFRIQL